MTLIGLRRSLHAMASMVFIAVAGSWVWLGKEAISDMLITAILAFTLFGLLANIVGRVEDRIAELEQKLKDDRL